MRFQTTFLAHPSWFLCIKFFTCSFFSVTIAWLRPPFVKKNLSKMSILERPGHCDAFGAVKMNSTDEMDRKFMLVAAHFLKLKFGIAKKLPPSPCKAKLKKSCFLVGQHSYICNGFGWFVGKQQCQYSRIFRIPKLLLHSFKSFAHSGVQPIFMPL